MSMGYRVTGGAHWPHDVAHLTLVREWNLSQTDTSLPLRD